MDARIYFKRFEHNVNQSTIHLPKRSVLVVVFNDKYGGKPAPLLEFHLNQTEETIDIPIAANSYFYTSNIFSFQIYFGVGIFDDKKNMILSPYSEIHGTVTEFYVLLSPSMFSIEGIPL